MTSPVLRVTPTSLRELAQRRQALAGQVAPALPAPSTSAWQASGVAVCTVNTGGSKAATAMRGRMTAGSGKLSTAAQDYESMDNDGAAALAAVPQDAAGFTPLVRRGSGVDSGAAGGFGFPK